jgi:hypothetical protein
MAGIGCRTCHGFVHHVLPGLGKFKNAASAKRHGRENNKRRNPLWPARIFS